MNPKPFSPLNHLTVPVVINCSFLPDGFAGPSRCPVPAVHW
jgi:hypothetical protein